MSNVHIRAAYDPHERETITFTKNTLTKQEMQKDCDINNIMARFEKTGLIDHVNENKGSYGDFSEIQSYQISLNQVIAAKAMFDSLPAKIRNRFNNAPQAFLNFVDDPENQEEMQIMGLIPNKTRADDLEEPEPAKMVAHPTVEKEPLQEAPGDPEDPKAQ